MQIREKIDSLDVHEGMNLFARWYLFEEENMSVESLA